MPICACPGAAISLFFHGDPVRRPSKFCLSFAVVAAAAVIAAAGRMEAVVNLLSHKWIHLTDGAILIFATAIIAVPEARERVPIGLTIRAIRKDIDSTI